MIFSFQFSSHHNKTTTYEDPRKWGVYEPDEVPEPRHVELNRDPELGFGFVAGSEKPVIVRYGIHWSITTFLKTRITERNIDFISPNIVILEKIPCYVKIYYIKNELPYKYAKFDVATYTFLVSSP